MRGCEARRSHALLRAHGAPARPATRLPVGREQTFATIAPYTIEEAYEVADAIERGDPRAACATSSATCCSRWCSTRAWPRSAAGSISPTSPRGIRDKLDAPPSARVRRRDTWPPRTLVRVLGGAEGAGRAERAARGAPSRCSAGRAARHCRRWRARRSSASARRASALTGRTRSEVRAKVLEELAEVDEALQRGAAASRAQAVAEEIGDLLFSVANWSRHLRGGPGGGAARAPAPSSNGASRAWSSWRRSARLELKSLSAPQWDELWRAAKLNGG